MNEQKNTTEDFNRREFLKGGSVATLMAMMGGVELFAQTNAAPATETKPAGPKIKIAVIGLGGWGREIVNTLALIPQADLAAICDTYPTSLRKASADAPGAAKIEDYKAILENKDIKAVVVATPTHRHKDIVLAALQAGKHVYCEAPLANTLEDARAIAAAAKAAKQLVFQSGLQLRSDPLRLSLRPHFRSGALGELVMARAQFHKKQSWRSTSPNPERERDLNWRLSKATSLGLIGEIGSHPIDQATWFLNAQPVAVTGFGSIRLWNQAKGDDRDVPDTIQAVLDFPGGIRMIYDATLASSFDAEYEMVYGSDAAIMLRDSKAWMFKEVDSPLGGWEVYASKETFYKETGIVLKAGGSKPVANAGQGEASPFTNTPLSFALQNFARNVIDVNAATEDAKAMFGDDADSIADAIGKVQKRAAAGYVEGYQATVTAIKANEAILSGQRLELKPEWYNLS